MKNNYLPSISVFSLTLPLLGLLCIWGIISIVKSSMIGDFPQKLEDYEYDQSLNQQLATLQAQNKSKQVFTKQWSELIQGDSFEKLNRQLGDSMKLSNDSKTLILTSQKRTQSKAGAVDSPSAKSSYGLRGTFKELQLSLLGLEAHMPQLMVNSLELSSSNNSKLLNLKIDYTAWEQDTK